MNSLEILIHDKPTQNAFNKKSRFFLVDGIIDSVEEQTWDRIGRQLKDEVYWLTKDEVYWST